MSFTNNFYWQEDNWTDLELEDGKKVLANVKNPYYDDDD